MSQHYKVITALQLSISSLSWKLPGKKQTRIFEREVWVSAHVCLWVCFTDLRLVAPNHVVERSAVLVIPRHVSPDQMMHLRIFFCHLRIKFTAAQTHHSQSFPTATSNMSILSEDYGDSSTTIFSHNSLFSSSDSMVLSCLGSTAAWGLPSTT